MSTRPSGLLRLVRASIALSPVADGVAGMSLAVAAGATLDGTTAGAALGASLCLFLFGMAHNDWTDREKDARLGRARPIPAGEVSAGAALTVILIAGAGALALAATTTQEALLLAVSMVVWISCYNLAPGHLGVFGPVLLGAIRAQNLALGAAALGEPGVAVPAAVAYFVYVVAVSSAARMEDGEVAFSAAGLRARLGVAQAAGLAAPAVTLAFIDPRPPHPVAVAALGLGVALAVWIERAWRAARAAGFGPGPTIPRLIGAALSGFFLFDASVAAAAGAWPAAAFLFLLFPVSRSLVRRFPPS